KFVDFIHMGNHNRIDPIDEYRIFSMLDDIRYKANAEEKRTIYDLEDRFRILKYQSVKFFTFQELGDWSKNYKIVVGELTNYINEDDKEMFGVINKNNEKAAKNNFLGNNYKLTIVY